MNKAEAKIEAFENFIAGIQSYQGMDTLQIFYDNKRDCLKVQKAMNEIVGQMELKIQKLKQRVKKGAKDENSIQTSVR